MRTHFADDTLYLDAQMKLCTEKNDSFSKVSFLNEKGRKEKKC